MMARKDFTIGWLASQTNCKIQTIRYYEQIGLMPVAPRSQGNRRLYGAEHAERLAFIRHGRQLGFPLEAIRELLSLGDDLDQPCEVADGIAQARLREVESRIERLQALKAELQRMIRQCRGGKISDCRVINVLADHSLCLHEEHTGTPGN
ncbi:MAG: helix-turn-helix domain-containing protein [Alphaproteobacteria bacterium]|jgi:DNA-binding transcriptional MerR regulator